MHVHQFVYSYTRVAPTHFSPLPNICAPAWANVSARIRRSCNNLQVCLGNQSRNNLHRNRSGWRKGKRANTNFHFAFCPGSKESKVWKSIKGKRERKRKNRTTDIQRVKYSRNTVGTPVSWDYRIITSREGALSPFPRARYIPRAEIRR